jgi:hypothetical protein
LLAVLLVVGRVFLFLRRRDNDSDTSNNNNDEMQSAREQASIGATAAPSTDYQNLSLAPAPPLTTTSEYAAVAVPAATGTVGRHYARAPPTGVYTKAPAAREYDVAGPLAPDGYGVVPPYGTVSAAAGDTGYGAAPPSVTGAGVSAYAVVDPGATLSSPYEAASTRLDL